MPQIIAIVLLIFRFHTRVQLKLACHRATLTRRFCLKAPVNKQ